MSSKSVFWVLVTYPETNTLYLVVQAAMLNHNQGTRPLVPYAYVYIEIYSSRSNIYIISGTGRLGYMFVSHHINTI